MDNLELVSFPMDRIIAYLSGEQYILYDAYIQMAKRAKKLALNRATVAQFEELVTALGK